MPNHCSNDLRLNGPKQDIARFFETLKGDDETLIDSSKIIPYPKHFADADKASRDFRIDNPGKPWSEGPKDGYNSGGYDWCVSNWGTKWGMYDFCKGLETKISALVSFQTAWSPPLPLILKASEMFPSLILTLRYYETGMGFKGVYKVKAGQVMLQNETTYNGQRGG